MKVAITAVGKRRGAHVDHKTGSGSCCRDKVPEKSVEK